MADLSARDSAIKFGAGRYRQERNLLPELGEEIGVVIRCQHEDIFQMMHRI